MVASTSSCAAIIHRHRPTVIGWTTPPASNARTGDKPCHATTVRRRACHAEADPWRAQLIVYTGEDYATFYRLAASAIPEGELRHGRPVALSDGSLEYPTEPDDIHGYECDAENPRRLRPAWPECPWRMLSVEAYSGLLDIRGICMHGKTGSPASRSRWTGASNVLCGHPPRDMIAGLRSTATSATSPRARLLAVPQAKLHRGW